MILGENRHMLAESWASLIDNEFLDTLASSEFNTLNNQFTLLLTELLITELKDFYLTLLMYI